jgi:hypothetical protein
MERKFALQMKKRKFEERGNEKENDSSRANKESEGEDEEGD